MNMFTAQEIRQLREKMGLSPTEFAVKVGVSYASVISWENGNRNPKRSHTIRLNEIASQLASAASA